MGAGYWSRLTGGEVIPEGLAFAQGRFRRMGLAGRRSHRVRRESAADELVAGAVRLNKIDAFRRNPTIGVVLLGHVSLGPEVPQSEAQVLPRKPPFSFPGPAWTSPGLSLVRAPAIVEQRQDAPGGGSFRP